MARVWWLWRSWRWLRAGASKQNTAPKHTAIAASAAAAVVASSSASASASASAAAASAVASSSAACQVGEGGSSLREQLEQQSSTVASSTMDYDTL